MITVLIVASTRQIETELTEATAHLPDGYLDVRYQSDYRLALESVWVHRPELVLVELTNDIDTLKNFVAECLPLSSRTAFVAVYMGDIFGEELSESEVLIELLRQGVRDFLKRPLTTDKLMVLFNRRLPVWSGRPS